MSGHRACDHHRVAPLEGLVAAGPHARSKGSLQVEEVVAHVAGEGEVGAEVVPALSLETTDDRRVLKGCDLRRGERGGNDGTFWQSLGRTDRQCAPGAMAASEKSSPWPALGSGRRSKASHRPAGERAPAPASIVCRARWEGIYTSRRPS